MKAGKDTHHLCVVGIEGLLIQGEFLRAKRVVELNHLRKLQAGINRLVKHQTGEVRQKVSVFIIKYSLPEVNLYNGGSRMEV